MKKIISLVAISIISSFSYANPTDSKLNDLGAVWKNYPNAAPEKYEHDLNIVYGGQDISLRPTLGKNSTFA